MKRPHSRMSGMTLVELMVAMTIGLMLTLAVTSLLITSESRKRVTTSTNDADQTGAYSFYELDRVIRGAGSAVADSAYPTDRGVLGCHLNAGSVLPRTAAFPTPFGNVLSGATSTLKLAPLLIAKNASQDASSDVIVVMSGSGAAGGVPRQITSAGSSTTLRLDNVVSFAANDVALVSQSGLADCLMEQISAVGTNQLSLGGTYYTTTASTTNISSLAASTASYVTPIGNTGANNLQFMMFGVGTDQVLYSFDFLQMNGVASQKMADGVYALFALYGVDTNGDAVQDTWVDPSGTYSLTNVMASTATMRKIVSVRIALIVRSNSYEGHASDDSDPAKVALFTTPTSVDYFNTLTDGTGTPLPALKRTLTFTTDQRHYRWRVFEFTVPLRNMLILAGAAAS